MAARGSECRLSKAHRELPPSNPSFEFQKPPMREFLPTPTPGTSYPIASDARSGRFLEEQSSLLEKIGANMNVSRAQTEGRVPSPISRAYMFFTMLFGRALETEGNQEAEDGVTSEKRLAASAGRRALQQEARQTFRGLCAVFALREALGIRLEAKSLLLNPQSDELSAVLAPALDGAPGGAGFWRPIRYYTVKVGQQPEEMLAGFSPLTGIFPAARPPRTLTGLYWYDSETGRWYDPTGTEFDDKKLVSVSHDTRMRVGQYLKAWLQTVTQRVQTQDLLAFSMSPRDASLVLKELTDWLEELKAVLPQGIEVRRLPLKRTSTGVPASSDSIPFCDWTCQGTADGIWSDLPLHNGRLLVTATQLRHRNIRIYGRIYGGDDRFVSRIDELEGKGDNLGLNLGLGETAIPLPYVLIDRLFTPNLTFLTTDGFSAEWTGLEVQNGSAREYCLIPLQPEILEIVDASELRQCLHAELSQDNTNYIVQLRFGDTVISQLYSMSAGGDYHVDEAIELNSFDLRFFPNFDLEALNAKELLPKEPGGSYIDLEYYARIRLSPAWTFRIYPFSIASGAVREIGTAVPMGTTNVLAQDEYSPGETLYCVMNEKPSGFYVHDRGFCLLELRNPVVAGREPAEWEVGIDFGTSNTCVAVRDAKEGKPVPLVLPVFTTTLLKTPRYSFPFGDVNEGASAVFDFFYKFDKNDTQLNDQEYFPTQILTQQKRLATNTKFDLRNGLIYFKNLSLTGVSILHLVQSFVSPESGGRKLHKRFNLKQDIKWKETDWLQAFMHHLRKQIILTAAYNNAKVVSTRFSYPRAFMPIEKRRFSDALYNVWNPSRQGVIPLVSESEAVRNFLVVEENQHVVFDVGGGTTDIIGFNAKQPEFQTSFKLAARQINEYVAASTYFRQALTEAIQGELGGKLAAVLDNSQFGSSALSGAGEQVLNTWIGLLQSIEATDPSGQKLASILDRLRERASEDDKTGQAIRGFFLSLVLQFCSIAFYAGCLLNAASRGTFARQVRGRKPGFPLTGVKLTLTGNGSKLYKMLTLSDAPFQRVFQEMFTLGLGTQEDARKLVEFHGLYSLPSATKPSPKVTVALGLLTEAPTAQMDPIPVANIVGEERYEFNGETTAFDTSLLQFYQYVQQNTGQYEAPRQAPPLLAFFLDKLGEILPNGKNAHFEVIPKAGRDWHLALKEQSYPNATRHLRSRVIANAREVDPELQEDEEVPSLEPLFICEVLAILQEIRETMAN